MDELRGVATIQAETAIIGSMLIDPRCIGEVLTLVSEDDFVYDSFRALFTAMKRLYNEGKTIDPIIVNERAGRRHEETMAEAMRITPTAANVLEYCALLREKTELRRLKAMADEINAARTLADAQEAFNRGLLSAAGRSRWKRSNVRDALNKLLDRLSDPAPPRFVRWGMPVLDSRLRIKADRGKFVLIGAESSVGKTAFALQLSFSLAATGRRVGFYSLETDEESAYDRTFVQQAQIKLRDLQDKKISEQELSRLTGIGEMLYKRPELEMEIIESAGATSSELRTDILTHRFDTVLIDYVQLMRAKGDERSAVVANLSMELHTMAQELGVLVIGLSQITPPTGQKYDAWRLVRKEELRESRQLISDADVIMLMSRTRQDDPNFRELLIDKNKDGPLGIIQMDFHPEAMTFVPHQNTKTEQFQNAMKAVAKAKKEAAGQVKLTELADDEGGDLPF